MGSALNVQAWSTTAASNDGADSTIGTVANTSSPTSVDDWVRGVMAAIAKYADDTGGALVAGGTATALTVTTGQSLSSAHIANGLRLAVRTASAATGAATIAIDSLTAVDIKKNGGSAIASGDWASGAILDLVYSSAATAFIAANIGPAGGQRAGMVLLDSGSFTSAANKIWELDAYSGYSSFKLVIHQIVPATDDVDLNLTFSTDSGSTFLSANYAWAATWHVPGSSPASSSSASTSLLPLWAQAATGDGIGNGASEGASFEIDILHANVGTFKPHFRWRGQAHDTGSSIYGVFGHGYHSTAQDVTDVRLAFSSGNIAASGTYALLGIP